MFSSNPQKDEKTDTLESSQEESETLVKKRKVYYIKKKSY